MDLRPDHPEAPPVRVALVALPESSAAVLYGLHEVYLGVGDVWGQVTGRAVPTRRMAPTIVAATLRPFKSPLGVPVVPEAAFSSGTAFDLVVVPDLALDDEQFEPEWDAAADWLRAHYEAGAMICSVCTGSVFLACAGLLDGLEATTHWSARPLFAQCYPKVLLRPERIISPAGPEHRIVTAGGSSAWAELAIYTIARFCGEEEARRIAKVFLFGDRSDGQLPFAAMVQPRQHDDAAVSASQAWIAQHYASANPVAQMAAQSGLTPRTFARRFKKATGFAPIDYVHTLRVEEAKQMLETTRSPLEEIAREVGYEDPAAFRRLFKRTTGVSPGRYRQRWQSLGQAAPRAGGAAPRG